MWAFETDERGEYRGTIFLREELRNVERRPARTAAGRMREEIARLRAEIEFHEEMVMQTRAQSTLHGPELEEHRERAKLVRSLAQRVSEMTEWLDATVGKRRNAQPTSEHLVEHVQRFLALDPLADADAQSGDVPTSQELSAWKAVARRFVKHQRDATDELVATEALKGHVEQTRRVMAELEADMHSHLHSRRVQTDDESLVEHVYNVVLHDVIRELMEEIRGSDGDYKVVPKSVRKLLRPKSTGSEAIKKAPAVHKLIATVLTDKNKADKVDDRCHHARDEFAPYLFNYFTKKYGMRDIVERNLIEFIWSCNLAGEHDGDIAFFVRHMLDVHDEASNDFLLAAWRELHAAKVGHAVVLSSQAVAATEDRAVTVTEELCEGMDKEHLHAAVARVRAACVAPGESDVQHHPSLANAKVVPMLGLLRVLAGIYDEERKRIRATLEALFRKHDADGDNRMSLGEFQSLANTMAERFSSRHAMRVYREACGPRDSLGRDEFVDACMAGGVGFAFKLARK